MTLFSIAVSVFLILNSLGNIPFFVGILGTYTVKRQRRIILRECLIALCILLLFNFFGEEIFGLLGISQGVVGIAGGTPLIFNFAFDDLSEDRRP